MTDLHSNIRIKNAVLYYEDKQIPLLSGEFHYWRISPDNWEAVADRIKAMGLNMVATYVPWNFHELSEGVYDFTGETRPARNLDGFLALMKKKELYVMIRPGPYIYAEWPFGGPPERASKFSRLDPQFLAMAQDYINAVSKVIVPHQITNGGSVIICQADNETYPELERCGEACGVLEKDGDFKDFLRRRYNNDIQALNRAWKTNYESFAEPCLFFHEAIVDTDRPMAERLLPDTPYKVRYYDTTLFIGDYAARLVGNVATWLRKNGIVVPLSANGWSPLYQNFKAMTDIIDLCGSDIYPGEYLRKANNGIQDQWRYNVDIIKQQVADSSNGNAWSAEFQAGTMATRISDHHRYIALFSMLNGLKGLNYYMLVNRDNWSAGPVNEWGQPTAHYKKTQEAIALYQKVEPWKCQIKNDFALFVSKAHRTIDPGNFESTFKTLKSAPFTYCYYNPEAADAPQEKVMLYCGSDWVLRSTGEKLRAYVENGGTLIAFNRFPRVDEFGEPLNLGFREPDGVRPILLPAILSPDGGKTSMRLANRGHANCKVNLFHYKNIPAGATPMRAVLSEKTAELLILIENTSNEVFTFGFVQNIGKGQIVQIGCAPDGEILQCVLKSIGQMPCADYQNEWLDITMFEHESGRRIVAVLSRSEQAQSVIVKLRDVVGNATLKHLENDTVLTGTDGVFRIDIPGSAVEFYELREE